MEMFKSEDTTQLISKSSYSSKVANRSDNQARCKKNLRLYVSGLEPGHTGSALQAPTAYLSGPVRNEIRASNFDA